MARSPAVYTFLALVAIVMPPTLAKWYSRNEVAADVADSEAARALEAEDVAQDGLKALPERLSFAMPAPRPAPWKSPSMAQQRPRAPFLFQQSQSPPRPPMLPFGMQSQADSQPGAGAPVLPDLASSLFPEDWRTVAELVSLNQQLWQNLLHGDSKVSERFRNKLLDTGPLLAQSFFQDAEEDPELVAGDKIQVTGETASNGQSGTLEEWDEDRKKWLVRKESGNGVYLSPDSLLRVQQAKQVQGAELASMVFDFMRATSAAGYDGGLPALLGLTLPQQLVLASQTKASGQIWRYLLGGDSTEPLFARNFEGNGDDERDPEMQLTVAREAVQHMQAVEAELVQAKKAEVTDTSEVVESTEKRMKAAVEEAVRQLAFANALILGSGSGGNQVFFS